MCILCGVYYARATGSPACVDGLGDLHLAAAAPDARAGLAQDTERVQPSGDARIDGVIFPERWSGGAVTYSDPDRGSDYEAGYWADDDGNGVHAPDQGFSQLSPAQLLVVHSALDTDPHGQAAGYAGFSVEGFTGLEAVYIGGGSGRGAIRVANSRDPAPPYNTAYSFFPAPYGEGGDVWFDESGARPVAGNYDFLTVIHELGHALGLKHPHEQIIFPAAPKAVDALEFTVMSYRSYVGDDLNGYGNEPWGFPQTYMMRDIAALQHMYGADFDTRAGDTVYSWDPKTGKTFVNGELAIAPGGNRVFLTIWDGGGTDRYDLSNYASGVRIDLTPGGHSVLSQTQLADLGGGANDGFARGNVYNALQYRGDPRSLIENAYGGSGRDWIRGNAADNRLLGNAGADKLYGREGDDRLLGGRGDDVLRGGSGDDVLRGGPGSDLLDGGPGADVLVGGPGDDVFRFRCASDSAPGAFDVLRAGRDAPAFEGAGVPGGDLIDLRGIDADTTRPGHQSLKFGGTGPGHLVLSERGKDTLVRADIDGDGAFEFKLLIEDGAVRARDYGAEDFIF